MDWQTGGAKFALAYEAAFGMATTRKNFRAVSGLERATKSVFAAILLTAVSGLSHPAHAYLDPGTGSIILQSIIGGIAAATAFGGMYWRKIKNFLSRFVGKHPASGDDEPK